jgi:hypothetical protein
MDIFQFKPTESSLERRGEDRRHVDERETPPPPRASHKGTWALLFIVILSTMIYKWRYVVYSPIWVARTFWADRSDLYKGRTNGISNKDLVWQARNYLSQLKEVDGGANLMAPEILRQQGAHLSISWFKKHVPDVVDYNPFMADGKGHFIVTWLYAPNCQKAVWKSSKLDADWYDVQGQPCYGVGRVSVFMDADQKLTTIKIDPIAYL